MSIVEIAGGMVAFVLEPTASVTREVRRVTRERLDEALSILDDLDDLDEADAVELERAIHEVRKRCKEVRAVARLVRSAIGDDFDQFDEAVSDAAGALAPIRDAHATLATFEHLRARYGLIDDATLDGVRSAQVAALDEATSGVGHDDPRIDGARTLLAASRKLVKRWHVPDGFTTFGAGIEDTYRRGRRAFGRARRKPTDDRMHKWRTSVKHLWYQVRLIERAAPSVLEASVASLDGLAEALGDDHDLAVLIERLDADPDMFGGEQQVEQVRRLVGEQQRDLRRRAFRLGATIYAEPPRAFARRMSAYWESTVEQGPELATGGIADLARIDDH